MSNNKKSKYEYFASGWIHRDEDGVAKLVSAQANTKYNKTKLKAVLEDGTELNLDSFAMFFNKNKKEEKHPDVTFAFEKGE